jgi:amino acid transporter
MSTHKISLMSAILMNMNIMIGGGVFAGPALMALSAGNASFIAWIVAALIFVPMVLSTSQLIGMFPHGGGFYQYAASGLGNSVGFLSAWSYVIGYTFAASVQVVFLRNTLISSFGENALTSNVLLFNACAVALMLFINLQSVRLISALLSSCTIVKLIPIIALIAIFPFQYNANFAISSAELSNLIPAVFPWALFGFLGFEACCSISHMIKDSEKNGPRALLIGFFGVAAIYSLFHFGLLQVMGLQNLITYGGSAFARFVLAPTPVISILDMLIVAAMTLTFSASLLGMMFGNISFAHALVEQKKLRGASLLGSVTASGRPWIIAITQATLIFVIATFITHIDTLAYSCNIGVFFAFIWMLLSLMKLQSKVGKKAQSVLSLLGALTAVGLVGYSLVLLGGATMAERLTRLAPVLGLLAAGFVLKSDN